MQLFLRTLETEKTIKFGLNAHKLDIQSPVIIDKWIDIDSEEFKRLNSPEEIKITKYFLKVGFGKDPFMFVDELGRIWGKGDNGIFWPFHFKFEKKNFGHRISSKAVN